MSFNAARSDALGTVLPRSGFFPTAVPPRYRAAAIEGELPDGAFPSAKGTSIQGWPGLYGFQATQTPSSSTFAARLPMSAWLQTGSSVVRSNDVAHAFLSDPYGSTNSFWRETRDILRPLDPAVDAILEDINHTLQRERDISAQRKHAGLSAVTRLVEMLNLSRPTVLRMGGVPESTFYSWQKSPHSIVRTPTVTRLLRLQAQVAILDEALGKDRMQAWIRSADRLDRLQGNEADFAQVLAEASAALAEATRVTPRRRMRRADYAAGSLDAPNQPPSAASGWPGATKIAAEESEQP
jgi:hypothetical protein